MKVTRGTFAAAASVAGLAAVLVGCASQAAAPNTLHLDVTSVDEKATVFEQIDLGKTGFGPGDQLVEEAPVVDSSDKTIGETVTTVAVVNGTGMQDMIGIVDCTVVMPDGNLLFHGAFAGKDLADGATLPVIGGTGQYAGATGTVMMVAPTDKRTDLKFDLVLPTSE